MNVKLFFPFALLLGLAACQSGSFFEEKKEIPRGVWTYRDTLDFRFSIADTSETYNLYLDFEYADTFSTQNIYLQLHTLFPDGRRLSKQKSFDLFDEQGASPGDCSGRRCRYHAILQEKAFFNQPGPYLITLEQYTRQDSLPGILAVGMTIEKTGKPK